MKSQDTVVHVYKYRLYPTPAQVEALDAVFWKARLAYNFAVQIQRAAHECHYDYISHYDLGKILWQYAKEFGWDSQLQCNTVGALAERVDHGYKLFFSLLKSAPDRAAPPRERSRSGHNAMPSVPYRKSGYKLVVNEDNPRNTRLHLWSVGAVRLRYHRSIPEGGRIKRCIVLRRPNGKFYAAFQVEMPAPALLPKTNQQIAVEVGLRRLVTLSDGTVISPPAWYVAGQKKRRTLQRKIDRQRRANNPQNYHPDGTAKRGARVWRKSNRQRATERQLANHEEHIAQQRWYFWHTFTDWLTRTYDAISMEDLSLKFMTEDERLAKRAHDAGFGMFRQMLEYKCAERGVQLHLLDPALTSQRCSRCGHIDEANLKTWRDFHCVACDHAQDSDDNAAQNLYNMAFQAPVQGAQGLIQTKRS